MKYSIVTYGCQMNEADSRLVAAMLDHAGWEESAPGAAADLIVINTCSVREKPEHKVYSARGALRPGKEARPGTVLAVVGCMAQREGERLLRRAPHVDAVLGTRCFHQILEVVARVHRGERPIVMTDLAGDPATSRCEVAEEGAATLRAFVPVILGCDNFCSYCIVPFVRGRELSRPADEVTSEVARLVARGCREVTLLGQNVLAWGRDLAGAAGFPQLLERVSEREGLWRVRFTTCHPRDVTDDLVTVMRDREAVCEQIHLPIQAGTDDLLQAMNRGYTAAHYEEIVRHLRDSVPGLAVTSDIMVGFPGETEEQFARSLDLYARIRFDAAFTFAYSPRPGTPAAARSDQIPPGVARARLQQLIELQNRITREVNAAATGAIAEVLVDGPAEHGEGLLAGKTRQNKQVVFPGSRGLAGRLARVRLTEADLWGFRGDLAGR